MQVFQERRTGSAPYMNPKWPSAHLSNRLYEVKVLVVQLCPTLCDPMDGRLPRSSVHGILQARILEWQPFPTPGDLPHPGIELKSPALAGGFFTI